jgi:hypothetical protein
MSERPDNLDEIMRTLPPRTAFYVPDDLLGLWFPPGIIENRFDAQSRRDAETYGAQFNCQFWYFPERYEGCFSKNLSAPPN